MKPARRVAPAWTVLWRWTVRAFFLAALIIGALMTAWRYLPPVSTLMMTRWARMRTVDRSYVRLDRISPHLQAAVVMSEDAQFCRHNGVDWNQLSDVIRAAAGGMPARGASTIPMQTVKNLFLWPSRLVIRKAIEIPLALVLDFVWPKRRILEVYLNIAQWGDGVFGIEAASRLYFHKPASALSVREAALLATSLPNPFLRDPARPQREQRLLVRILERRMRGAAPWLDCLQR